MILRAAALVFLSGVSFAQSYWPTQGWKTSPPEEQGLSSDKLAEAVEFVVREKVRAHSLLVIRNGFVVADAYFYPYAPNTRHDVASVTKSITSTLVGLAIDKGLIKAVSEPVLGLFPDRTPANLDDRKRAMTLEDLLTMRSGLQCINSPTEVTLSEMMRSPDWVQYMLDLPMADAPGTRFVYDSGAVNLLSAIVRRATGKKALEFARRALFEPLGIKDVVWPTDPRGEDNHGWGDLQLRPHDMAKIGYMFLNGGKWDGKQILSLDWVRRATQRRVSLSGGESYGYLWWMTALPLGLIEARGRGGQRIIIWPEKNALIVFTGGGFEPGRVGPYLLAAVKSDQPLAANPAGAARLEAAVRRAAEPPALHKGEVAPALPKTAAAISGKRFALEPNSYSIRGLTLTFNSAKEAVLRLDTGAGPADKSRLEFRVGLDGSWHLAAGRYGLPAACRGAWKSPNTFVAELDEVANINRFSLELTFEDGRLSGTLAEATGLGSTSIRGRLE